VQEEMIVVPATSTGFTDPIVGVGLTEQGRARLAVD
jgi:hypothetical protein